MASGQLHQYICPTVGNEQGFHLQHRGGVHVVNYPVLEGPAAHGRPVHNTDTDFAVSLLLCVRKALFQPVPCVMSPLWWLKILRRCSGPKPVGSSWGISEEISKHITFPVCGGEETGFFLEEAQGFQGWRTEGLAENIFYPCENRKTHKYSDKQEPQEMALTRYGDKHSETQGSLTH